MKKIKVANLIAVQAQLDIQQVGAKVNVLTAADVARLAQEAEEKLERLLLPKKCRRGAVLSFSPAGPTAAAYKYGQGATGVTLVRGPSDWYVLSLSRGVVYPKKKEVFRIALTPAQSIVAIGHFTKLFDELKVDICSYRP